MTLASQDAYNEGLKSRSGDVNLSVDLSSAALVSLAPQGSSQAEFDYGKVVPAMTLLIAVIMAMKLPHGEAAPTLSAVKAATLAEEAAVAGAGEDPAEESALAAVKL